MTFGYEWAPPQWRAAVDLDTLAAAWGLTPDEIATIVGVTVDVIDGWRRSDDEGWSEDAAAKVAALARLHVLIWMAEAYPSWRDWWRRKWAASSPIGAAAPIEAALAEPAAALETLTGFLAGHASG